MAADIWIVEPSSEMPLLRRSSASEAVQGRLEGFERSSRRACSASFWARNGCSFMSLTISAGSRARVEVLADEESSRSRRWSWATSTGIGVPKRQGAARRCRCPGRGAAPDGVEERPGRPWDRSLTSASTSARADRAGGTVEGQLLEARRSRARCVVAGRRRPRAHVPPTRSARRRAAPGSKALPSSAARSTSQASIRRRGRDRELAHETRPPPRQRRAALPLAAGVRAPPATRSVKQSALPGGIEGHQRHETVACRCLCQQPGWLAQVHERPGAEERRDGEVLLDGIEDAGAPSRGGRRCALAVTVGAVLISAGAPDVEVHRLVAPGGRRSRPRPARCRRRPHPRGRRARGSAIVSATDLDARSLAGRLQGAVGLGVGQRLLDPAQPLDVFRR